MALNDMHYDFLRKVILERSGIELSSDQAYLIESKLAPLVRELGLATLADLADQMIKSPFGPLHQRVLQAMMNHESLFFRDNFPFELFRSTVMPEIIKTSNNRSIHIWSAACSAGQEAYSLAMILKSDFSNFLKQNSVKIHASDLSKDILKKAETGLYSEIEVNRGLPINMRNQYFDVCPTGWKIKNDVKNLVEFSVQNLLQPWSFDFKMDVIFARHVLIYMNQETKKSLVERFINLLHPGGYLFLGSSETLMGNSRLKFIDGDRAFCYQKV